VVDPQGDVAERAAKVGGEFGEALRPGGVVGNDLDHDA
jgi:hypothetical protein